MKRSIYMMTITLAILSLLLCSCSHSFPPMGIDTSSLLTSRGRTGRIPAEKMPLLKKRAIESGDAHASHSLHEHFQSIGNREESLVWLRLAALQGNPNSMQSLSAFLAHGKVHPAQQLEAAYWGLVAADCGCKVARELNEIGTTFRPPTRLYGR